MIKFFRKIRYDLMNQNKTTKYFKYAIGEIFLVVIGILIALQINNWNENNKNNQEEEKILYDLLQEFNGNKVKFNAAFTVKKQALNNTRQFLKLLKQRNISMDTINIALKNSLGVWAYNPSSGVINTITNTGKIDLIQNDSLKYALSNWKDILVDYQEEEEIHLNWFLLNYEPYINRNLPKRNKYNKDDEYMFNSKPELEVIYNKVIKEKEFQNLYLSNERYLYRAVSEGDYVSRTIDNIINLLSNEIKKRN